VIDPLLPLAVSTQTSRGVYALLLGSGTSRAAAIPTGWEIVLDLVRKVAILSGADTGADPEAWYKRTYGEGPRYDRLLELLAPTPAERQGLLRPYIEPSREDRDHGRKVPTAAHRAIADLVARGYVRVILTTNFDRLIEQACQERGVALQVVATADAAKGMRPLVHSEAVLVKLNGDYLDTRIRNIAGELAHYEPTIDPLLDRIFDEYGLIVTGWSAEWDDALVAVLERCPVRRFSTYWTSRGPVSGRAAMLVAHRDAHVVTVQSAETFFPELAEKVLALEELARPHPLSAEVAVATLKTYLTDPRDRIRLRDLVHQEIEHVVAALQPPMSTYFFAPTTINELRPRMARYESMVEILSAMAATGSYWATEEQRILWVEVVARLVNLAHGQGGIPQLLTLHSYPALILFYTAGLGALARGNYLLLAALFDETRVKTPKAQVRAAAILIPWVVIEADVQRHLLEIADAPLSLHLYRTLRGRLKEALPDDDDYTAAFDRFEVLLALERAHLLQEQGRSMGIMVGRAGRSAAVIVGRIDQERRAMDGDWPPLQAGLFGGSESAFEAACSHFLMGLREIYGG
jgi:hypothetical protein